MKTIKKFSQIFKLTDKVRGFGKQKNRITSYTYQYKEYSIVIDKPRLSDLWWELMIYSKKGELLRETDLFNSLNEVKNQLLKLHKIELLGGYGIKDYIKGLI